MTYVSVGEHRLEVHRLAPSRAGLPTLVFLHEGLGSAELWRGFPQALAGATGCGAVAYSRYGYGRSDPFAEPRAVRYMHDEAERSLPDLLDQLSVTEPLLVGHSDGASIALLHAATSARPVTGLALLAPHVFVEDRSIEGIESARRAYLDGDLRGRLAKYHDDPDATFFGWNDIWLSPEFRSWSIEDALGGVTCPTLVVQGTADPYGTLEQARRVAAGVRESCDLETIDGCGHLPHLEQPERTLAVVSAFVARVAAADPSEPRR